MPERWERELQTLRRAGPRADLWPRVEEGPHGTPSAPPSGRKRLLAGGVAFAVFIAAGLFAWNAFQPAVQEGLPPAGSPQAIMAFNEADPRTPTLTLTVGGDTYAATLGTHSYSFAGGNGFMDAVTPTFTDADAIPVVRGTPLLIANAPPTLAMSAYEGMTVNWGPPVGSPLPLDLTAPGWDFDLPPGRYLVVGRRTMGRRCSAVLASDPGPGRPAAASPTADPASCRASYRKPRSCRRRGIWSSRMGPSGSLVPTRSAGWTPTPVRFEADNRGPNRGRVGHHRRRRTRLGNHSRVDRWDRRHDQ